MCGAEPRQAEVVVECVTVEAWTWEVRTVDACPSRLDNHSLLCGASPRASLPAADSHPQADPAAHAVGKNESEMPWARAAQGPTLPVLARSAGMSRPLNSVVESRSALGLEFHGEPGQMPPPSRLQQSLERITQRAGAGIPSQPTSHETYGVCHAAAEDLPSSSSSPPSSLYHAYLEMVSRNLPIIAARRLQAASTAAGLQSPLQRDKQRRDLTCSRTRNLEPRPGCKAPDAHSREDLPLDLGRQGAEAVTAAVAAAAAAAAAASAAATPDLMHFVLPAHEGSKVMECGTELRAGQLLTPAPALVALARSRALALAHTTGGCKEPEEDKEAEGADAHAARHKRSYSELLVEPRSFCGDVPSAFSQPFRKRARSDTVGPTTPSLPTLWQSGSLLRGRPAYVQAWEEAVTDASAGLTATTPVAEASASKRAQSDNPARTGTFGGQPDCHSHSLGPTSHHHPDESSCPGELSRWIFAHHLARYGSGPAALPVDLQPRTSTLQAPLSSCPPHCREGADATITAAGKGSEGSSRAVEGTGVYESQMERIRTALSSHGEWEGNQETEKQHLQRWEQRQQQQSRQKRKQALEVKGDEEEARGSDKAGLGESEEDGELACLEQDLLLQIEDHWRKESIRCRGQAQACNTKDAAQVEGSQGTPLVSFPCSDAGWDKAIQLESHRCIFPSCSCEPPTCPCEQLPSCSPEQKRGIDVDLNEYPTV